MTASALFLGVLGMALNFAPQEVAAAFGASAGPFVTLALQVLAGSLLGMGAVNWMWKANAIGGIYGRPVGVGNLLHFTVGSFALGRAVTAQGPTLLFGLLAAYVAFALWFGYVVFGRSPAAGTARLS